MSRQRIAPEGLTPFDPDVSGLTPYLKAWFEKPYWERVVDIIQRISRDRFVATSEVFDLIPKLVEHQVGYLNLSTEKAVERYFHQHAIGIVSGQQLQKGGCHGLDYHYCDEAEGYTRYLSIDLSRLVPDDCFSIRAEEARFAKLEGERRLAELEKAWAKIKQARTKKENRLRRMKEAVRLLQYELHPPEPKKQKARRDITPSVRYRILCRDNSTCQVCGDGPVDGKRVNVFWRPRTDHVYPVKHGGDSEDDNLCTLCYPCNAGKAATLVWPAHIKAKHSSAFARLSV